ncbi:MAG TPA: orotidine-5'-phosphate decarboxylase [Gammaproteobacteria bacterium]|nr:orotidine-5'-phosphate decarboxylase [Gammaproteobacteria bacterium]
MAPSESPLIVALDLAEPQEAVNLARQLRPDACRLKVGKELFTRGGPAVVESLQGLGFEVFLDLKFHDIPNTVARACAAAAELGVWMVNVHTLGGRPMMEAARDAVEGAAHRPLLIGVTILTSMRDEDLHEVGLAGTAMDNVSRLAALAESSGLDGVVCSPREARGLRAERGAGFRLVTPGIRPAWSAADDQARITTPADALSEGASYIVVGRPITGAADPPRALEMLMADLHSVSGGGGGAV